MPVRIVMAPAMLMPRTRPTNDTLPGTILGYQVFAPRTGSWEIVAGFAARSPRRCVALMRKHGAYARFGACLVLFRRLKAGTVPQFFSCLTEFRHVGALSCQPLRPPVLHRSLGVPSRSFQGDKSDVSQERYRGAARAHRHEPGARRMLGLVAITADARKSRGSAFESARGAKRRAAGRRQLRSGAGGRICRARHASLAGRS